MDLNEIHSDLDSFLDIKNCDYVEKEMNLLENDQQCGNIYFNVDTRLLKFGCTYCRQIFDNINIFCDHLSEHLSDYDLEADPAAIKYEKDEIMSMVGSNASHETADIGEPYKCKEVDGEEEMTDYAVPDLDTTNISLKPEFDDLNVQTTTYGNSPVYINEEDPTLFNEFTNFDEMIIEEIDESEEIREEVEQEMQCTEFDYMEENSFSQSFKHSNEEDMPLDNSADVVASSSNQMNAPEDCVRHEKFAENKSIKEEFDVKERNKPITAKPIKNKLSFQEILRRKGKRKRITTVKVIAVRNRIAELYERIKIEEQKRSQLISSSNYCSSRQFVKSTKPVASQNLANQVFDFDQDTQDATEGFIGNESIVEPITRKIIGETLITLIPEGGKIPNTMPTKTMETMLSKNEIEINKKLTENSKNYADDDDDDNEGDANKPKRAICPACGKTFRSHFSLTIHKRIHYLESDSNVKLAHKCSDCDQLFNKLTQLKQHIELIHYPEGFICKICDKKLSSLSLLERHMIKVHLERPFNCKQCGKNFSDANEFEQHLQSHNSGKLFKCMVCGRKYNSEFFLIAHMRKHKQQVPQTCVVCGKRTLRITQHMKIHTPRPKRLLSCSVCSKVFNFSSGLSHHFKIMHKLPRPPPKPKKDAMPTTSAIKRKRKTKADRNANEQRQQTTNSNANKLHGQSKSALLFLGTEIIEEEQVDMHDNNHKLYNTMPNDSMTNIQDSYQTDHQYPLIIRDAEYEQISQHQQEALYNCTDSVVNHKEEEAKRVIVELIENSSYPAYFADNFTNVLEAAPPIAREEEISAVNSIVNKC